LLGRFVPEKFEIFGGENVANDFSVLLDHFRARFLVRDLKVWVFGSCFQVSMEPFQRFFLLTLKLEVLGVNSVAIALAARFDYIAHVKVLTAATPAQPHQFFVIVGAHLVRVPTRCVVWQLSLGVAGGFAVVAVFTPSPLQRVSRSVI
jgi:hypothetical protein